MSEVFIAILEDRHEDIQLEVFTTFAGAAKQIINWQLEYTNETWIEKEIESWEYYVHSDCEDGPNMRIEKKEVRDSK